MNLYPYHCNPQTFDCLPTGTLKPVSVQVCTMIRTVYSKL